MWASSADLVSIYYLKVFSKKSGTITDALAKDKQTNK